MSKYHIVRLGELISPANVIKCGTNIYPVLSMTMHDGIVLQSNRFKKSLASLDTSEYKVVKEGQLVVGFPIDEGVLYIQHHSFEGIMSPAYDVYNVDYSRITGVYLESALHSPQSMQYYASKLRGTTARRRSIPKKDLFELPIILPDLATQKHITDIISYANKLIEICKSILEKTDTLVKSRFVEMFGDLHINSKDWEYAKFTDIADIDGTMTTDFEKYANYPHIGIDSIQKNTGDLIGYRTVSEDNVVSGKYLFSPKHIIYSKIRPNLNKVALPTFNGVCSADAYPILPIDGKCNRTFLAYVMRSDYFLNYILQFCMRTNLPKVNRKELSGFVTPLPSLNLQNQFADFVTQIDKSKLAVKHILEKAETLKKSLMQEYFG